MKIFFIILIVLVLTILFGAVPLTIAGTVFEVIGGVLKTLGKWLDWFGWGGVLTVQNLSIKGVTI